ncbi:hypothetical protein OH807_00365 [Kitasatospora sp. NBC_01560]|uniref:hypothetical protein n=1 Tax=Kitasatospora sp. NBC_01560 TaxID=2975965 RepID=UPI00386F229E
MAGSIRAGVAVLAALLLTWVAGAPPAAATWSEGHWMNSGGSARTPSTPAFTTDGTTQWRLIRGEDNGLWISRNNGQASRMNVGRGPAGTTYVAPEIIVARGHLYAFHTGTDHQVYYSSTVQGTYEGRWTEWRSIPGFADTTMAPSVTVIDTDGSNLGIFVTRTNGHVAGTQMDLHLPEYPGFGGWTEDTHGVYRSRPDVTSRYNPLNGRTEIMGVATGMDDHGWTVFSEHLLSVGIPAAPVFSGNLAATIRNNNGPQRLAGASSLVGHGPSIAHGGRDDRLSTDTSSEEFFQEQQVGITILVPTAGILTVGHYNNGGRPGNAGNWRALRESFAPSEDSPQIHGMREALNASLTWLSAQNYLFPNHAIVEKRL